jgi:hypothetical protein
MFNFKFQGYKALLYALAITLLAFPILDGFTYIRAIIGIVFIGVLLIAVRAVANLRKQVLFSGTLGVVALIGYFGDLLGYGAWLEAIGMLGFGLFFATVGIIILTNIMLHIRRVTAELIYGAINVYLLIGLSFTFMLALVEFIQPGSITGLESLSVADDSVMPFLYFSFVTMTTLGYGDMSPATGPAASLVYVEAVVGQLYVAIMMARLVGLYVAHESDEDQQYRIDP